MIFTFEQLKTFTKALAAVRYWNVPVTAGKVTSHVTVMHTDAAEALALVRRHAKAHGWTIADDAKATEHPKFAKGPKPAAPSPAAPANAPAHDVTSAAPANDHTAPAAHEAPADAAHAATPAPEHAAPAPHDAPTKGS